MLQQSGLLLCGEGAFQISAEVFQE